MPSFLRMLARWLSTVLMLRTSVVAISFGLAHEGFPGWHERLERMERETSQSGKTGGWFER
jgi:hypothetical protein